MPCQDADSPVERSLKRPDVQYSSLVRPHRLIEAAQPGQGNGARRCWCMHDVARAGEVERTAPPRAQCRASTTVHSDSLRIYLRWPSRFTVDRTTRYLLPRSPIDHGCRDQAEQDDNDGYPHASTLRHVKLSHSARRAVGSYADVSRPFTSILSGNDPPIWTAPGGRR